MSLREALKDPHVVVPMALLAYLGCMAMGALIYREICEVAGRLL